MNPLLETLAQRSGSDLHLKVGSPPIMRIDGVLHRLDGERLTGAETWAAAESILPEDRRHKLQEQNEIDFAYSVPGLGRFRVNAFRQRGSMSLVIRSVQVGVPSFEDLGLPEVVGQLADAPRGLILVTGPTGSGKTTTLAAIIDRINASKPVHILTLEDPIEYLHADQMATINQRELGIDTDNYANAMRSAMRQDPDVILVGEMRDLETVGAAMAAGETGHLVLSTLHTIDTVETINRIVDFFPSYQQHQARITLSGSLRGVISQRLVPRIGGGRVPALEIMVMNGRIADRVIDSKKTSEIHGIIAEGEYYGMQTFDQSLLSLVMQGLVTPEDAMHAASVPHDFSLMLEQAGLPVPA
ncbi:MAG TPA: type IV pilus twitching motility protein PilT [Actinomycetota bacterium]|jgi:twitching motility protein PilT